MNYFPGSSPPDAPDQQDGKPAAEGKPKTPVAKKQSKKRKWRKPKDMPKRPLSAYNLFFAHERQEMLKTGSLVPASSDSDLVGNRNKKMGFAGLARTVAAKWKSLDSTIKAPYEKQAQKEQERYQRELKEWKENQEKQKTKDQLLQAQMVMWQQRPGGGMQPRSLSEPLLGIFDNLAANGNHGNQILSEPAASWPAMPQTVASLGNLLCNDEQQFGVATPQHEQPPNLPNPQSLATRDPNPQMRSSIRGYSELPVDTSINGLAHPKASDMMSMMHQQIATHSRNNTAFFPPGSNLNPNSIETMMLSSEMRNNVNPPAPATQYHPGPQLASQQGLDTLAAKLDEESFDFLKSLQNSKDSPEGK